MCSLFLRNYYYHFTAHVVDFNKKKRLAACKRDREKVKREKNEQECNMPLILLQFFFFIRSNFILMVHSDTMNPMIK